TAMATAFLASEVLMLWASSRPLVPARRGCCLPSGNVRVIWRASGPMSTSSHSLQTTQVRSPRAAGEPETRAGRPFPPCRRVLSRQPTPGAAITGPRVSGQRAQGQPLAGGERRGGLREGSGALLARASRKARQRQDRQQCRKREDQRKQRRAPEPERRKGGGKEGGRGGKGQLLRQRQPAHQRPVAVRAQERQGQG